LLLIDGVKLFYSINAFFFYKYEGLGAKKNKNYNTINLRVYCLITDQDPLQWNKATISHTNAPQQLIFDHSVHITFT
jgi:hypothetical protein